MRRHTIRLLTLLALVVAPLTAQATLSGASAATYTTSSSPSWVPNGTVYAMARSGNRIYLGGSFTTLTDPTTGQSVSRSHVAALDATTGAPLAWNPGVNGVVRALAVAPNSKVYAGGNFTAAGGQSAVNLAAFTSGGARATVWKAEANNVVRDIAVDGTRIYVAGNFGKINGATRVRLARVSAWSGSLDRSFQARVGGGYVYSMAFSGSDILLGGNFKSLGGQARLFSGSVTRATGAVTSWAPPSQCTNCPVLDLATDGTRVYEAIGGTGGRATAFSLSTGARLWSKYSDGDVQAIDVSDGVVYVGGHFSHFTQGLSRHQLVTLAPTDGALSSYALPFTGSDGPGVWSMLVDSSTLRIGGGFKLKSGAAKYAAFNAA